MFYLNEAALFLPIPVENLLVNLESSRNIIISTLDLIQTSFNNNPNRDGSKFIDSIDACYLLAKESGGKILLFTASQSVVDHVSKFNINF